MLSTLASTRLVATAIVSALLAFGAGVWMNSGGAPMLPLLEERVVPTASAGLAEENHRLRVELQRASADLEARKGEHTKLLAERAAAAVLPARTDEVIGAPLERHEVQSAVLSNLRQLRAAVDQFQLERGRAPASIHEVVGRDAYLKRLVSVDGEDYESIALAAGGSLTVTTAGGITVKYGDGPEATTAIEYPPELARVKAMEAKVRPALRTALEAYRMAHRGKDPDDNRALVPFFAEPEQAADFLELLDARK